MALRKALSRVFSGLRGDMRCYCCDKVLSNYEATLRRRSTDEFTDMCLTCLKGLSIPTYGNKALLLNTETDDDYTYEDISMYINDTPKEDDE